MIHEIRGRSSALTVCETNDDGTRQCATEARSGARANSFMPSSKAMFARKPIVASASAGEAKTWRTVESPIEAYELLLASVEQAQ